VQCSSVDVFVGAEGLLHNLTMLPTSPRDGATLQFNCTFRYVFAQVQIQLRRFVWFLNDMKLSRVTSGRLKINVSQPDLTGTWHSTLTFDPATAKDSGKTLTCTCRRVVWRLVLLLQLFFIWSTFHVCHSPQIRPKPPKSV